ncbi:MAG: hypothetical protein M1351_02270 [Candidatus Thermoplasmatota archaeon]|nr:hypothetical protein [Candidatus Thermoplasmatota archaeon]
MDSADGQGLSVPQSQKPKNKKVLYTIIAVVVAVVVIAGIVIASGALSPSSNTPPPNNNPPPPTTQTLITSGDVWQLSSGQYEYVQISLSAYATITGGFSVTGGSATFYIFTPSEYANYGANGTAASYLYTTGQVTSGGVNTNLNGGTYYFVFQSDNSVNSESVSITTDFIATY